MNRIKLFRLLLISLVMLAYQTHITHFHIVADKECNICMGGKSIESASHHISFIVDTSSLEIIQVKKQIVREKAITYSPESLLKQIDFRGMRHYQVANIPLGYSSHAPPYKYS